MERIFCREFGQGKPVILIHGFCETHEIWTELAKSLAINYRVFTIDLPGFGNSPLPISPFSIDEIGNTVFGWIEENKIENPVVMGHSLGGYVTLAMLRQNKKIFSGIGLIHSTAMPDSDERKINRDRVIEFVTNQGVNPFIDTFVPALFFDKANPSIGKFHSIAKGTTAATVIAYTKAMRDRPSYVPNLNAFENPVLFLGGEKDEIIKPNSIQELSVLTKQPTVKILAKTAHVGMYENVEEFFLCINQFCQKSFNST